MITEKFCAENIFVNSFLNEIVIRVQRARANIYRARMAYLVIIRQLGAAGIREFMNAKTVWIA